MRARRACARSWRSEAKRRPATGGSEEYSHIKLTKGHLKKKERKKKEDSPHLLFERIAATSRTPRACCGRKGGMPSLRFARALALWLLGFFWLAVSWKKTSKVVKKDLKRRSLYFLDRALILHHFYYF
jgi:hypothetical protein